VLKFIIAMLNKFSTRCAPSRNSTHHPRDYFLLTLINPPQHEPHSAERGFTYL
jgi:hypothetical protein